MGLSHTGRSVSVARSSLTALLRIVGLTPDLARRTTITGKDPVFASRFALAEATTAVLAACAGGAAACWELRTGRPQNVHVAVQHAAATLQSVIIQRVNGNPVPLASDALNDFFQTRDGRWIHLLGEFPHLIDGTLQVLGCALEASQIANAVAKWDAFGLEDALAAAGMCGVVTRTAAEWAEHPQARALETAGPVEIVRFGHCDPKPFKQGEQPLSGVRVLDLTRVLAGPSNGKILAQYGADVMLVSSPSLPNIEACVIDTGAGKRSAFLDLNDETGVRTLWSLIEETDVFVQSYRPGALESRGFSHERLATVRPGIIYVSISSYGDVGPWRSRRGWEPLAEAATGLAIADGTPSRPRHLAAAACDYATGYLAALGTISALWRRAREGGSYLVRASLAQTAMWLEKTGAVCNPAAATGFGEPSRWMFEAESPFGRLRQVRPVAEMSETPSRWTRPPVPLGTHPPTWTESP